MEILLDADQVCNLTTIVATMFVNNSVLDEAELLRAQRLSVRSGMRMTFVDLELHNWDIKQKRDRLIGCSLTGWQDMVNATNMSREEQIRILKALREAAHDEAEKYAKELGIETPLLSTTVKPEGTLSNLPGVSPGLHYSHSPYYIRRVRINAHDPLVKVCEELGYDVKPENGQTWETCSTKVISFPCKAPKGTTKFDVTAIEQLENYKMFMDNYVDHNASITVHVREHEWEEVEQWMWDNWDEVVAVSFLPLSDSFYQQMPYEAVDEHVYSELSSQMKPFVPSLISKYESMEATIDIGNDGCESGACPIR